MVTSAGLRSYHGMLHAALGMDPIRGETSGQRFARATARAAKTAASDRAALVAA